MDPSAAGINKVIPPLLGKLVPPKIGKTVWRIPLIPTFALKLVQSAADK